MKNLPHAAFTAGLTIAIFAIAGICPRAQSQAELPFRLVNGNLVVVSLVAGNGGPIDFVLDTGADTTIVGSSLAGRLSLVPLGPVQQTTLSGVRSVPRGSLAALSAASVQVNNLPVMVQDLSELRRLDSHIRGIAGQDFLSHFNYLLDYRRHVIRIEAGSEIQDALVGERVRMEASGNRMIVESDGQSLRSAKLRLLLDSGASSLVLTRSGSQALKVPAFETVSEVTSGGNINLRTGRVHALAVGLERFHDIAAVLSVAEPTEPIGDGLLPTILFQALYVNNREGFVVFNPRSRKN